MQPHHSKLENWKQKQKTNYEKKPLENLEFRNYLEITSICNIEINNLANIKLYWTVYEVLGTSELLLVKKYSSINADSSLESFSRLKKLMSESES